MKSKMLLTSLNEVNDEYVEDADAAVASVKRFGWVKWVAVAACVLIAVLIAVPALDGKAPKVEPESTEPTPVEEPANEPTNEPTDMPEDSSSQDDAMGGGLEVKDGEFGEERMPTGTWTGPGPVAYVTFPHWFTSYEDFSSFVQDPVFEAFLNSDEGQKHDVVFFIGNENDNAFFTTRSMDDLYSTSMILDPVNLGPANEFYHLDTYEGNDRFIVEELDEFQQTAWSADNSSVTISYDYQMAPAEFETAEKYGVLNTYTVNGVEIQIFDRVELNIATLEESVEQNPDNPAYKTWLENARQELDEDHLHLARVNIDGVWYEVSGYNEANVTTIVEALARIAG